MNHERFKQCPHCEQWFSAHDIMNDPEVALLGMTFEEENIELNMYFFTHSGENCGTTFAIPVEQFLPYLAAPPPMNILMCSEECNELCLDINNMAVCNAPCYYAPFRRLLKRMLEQKNQRIKC